MLIRTTTLLASFVVLAPALTAGAQDALGDGRILDANLNARGPGNLSRTQPDYNARNRLVTGNVMGGRGFRGTVGYTATDAFRGVTGEDTTYRFRADSGFSDINFATYSQTLNRLRFGQNLGIFAVPAAVSTASIQSGLVGSPPPSIGSTISSRIQLDRMNVVNSLSAEAASGAEPTIIGGFLDDDGAAQFLQSSSLAGLVKVPTDRLTSVLGLSRLDHARLNEDITRERTLPNTIGVPYDEPYVNLAAEAERLGSSASDPIGSPVDAADGSFDTLQAIRERVAARAIKLGRAEDPAADDEEILNNLDEALRRLREEILGADPTGEDPDASPESGPQDPEPVDPEPVTDPTVPLENVRRAVLNPSVLAAIRDGVTIDRLAAPTETRLDELLTDAQQMLQEGRYLSAERQFSRALRFSPRHPLATTGVLLSQIGAGVYSSAGLTVREAFIGRPELMGAAIDPALHPSTERLDLAETTLRQRLTLDAKPDEALLLAYLGHLRQNDDLIREGLGGAEAARPDDRLVPILRDVWLNERP